MNARSDLERRLASFYEAEAPKRAPDRVLATALDTIESTPQRRSIIRAPWRFPDMNRYAKLAAAAIAVAALAAVGSALTGFGGGPRPQPSPTLQPTSISTLAPSPDTASTFVRPFTYVLPAEVQVDFGPRTSNFWELRVPDSGGEGLSAWFLMVQSIGGGREEPCSLGSANLPMLNARAAMDYLVTVPTVGITNETP